MDEDMLRKFKRDGMGQEQKEMQKKSGIKKEITIWEVRWWRAQ